VSPRGLRRGQVNCRSHNSCLSLGAPSPGRRRACVLFGVFFRGGYSPTGLPGDTVWLALPSTGWGGLSVLSQLCRRTPRQRSAPFLGGYMLSPPHKSRRPSMTPRECPRAQRQNELPSIFKYKYLNHTHTAMHDNGTAKQADDRKSTLGIGQTVRGKSDLPARAWGAASTEVKCVLGIQ